MTNNSVEIKKGLRDVYLDGTLLSFIDGRAGELYYYGFNIHDIAENATFEEVAYLMLHGKLPTYSELSGFEQKLIMNRLLPENVINVIMARNLFPVRNTFVAPIFPDPISLISCFLKT